jgi:hypothetical protein
VNRKAATAKADRLFSLKVREVGYCQLAAWFPQIECNGNLQACHIVSRRYRAVRWLLDPANAVPGCAAHHLYGTHHPLEWVAAAESRPEIDYEGLRDRALNDPPMDPFEVITTLEAM